jgi:hypothetical protein
LLVSALVALAACPPPMMTVDSGTPIEDAGLPEDAGVDAGRPPRDAGIPDAGFLAAPLGSWCDLRSLAECERDRRCGRLGDAGFPGCLSQRRQVSVCDQAALTRSVGEGRLQYLDSEGLKCLNGFGAGSCEDTPLFCGSTFTGLTPPDGGCFTALECDAFGFCNLYDDQCPHRCTGWTPLGSSCDGFYRRCDPSSAGCDETDAGVAVCQPKKDAGASCVRFDACGDAMTCSNGKCVVRQAGLGEACGVEGGFPFCTEEYFCRQGPPVNGMRPPGTCQRKAGLQGTCTGPGSCLPSLRCSTLITTGTCLVKAGFHQGCISYDDCEDGLYCDSKTQQCERLPVAGGDCSFEVSGYRCAPGHTCSFSTAMDVCEAWKANGEACGYDGQCLSNDCQYATLPDGGFGGTCRVSCSVRADGGS